MTITYRILTEAEIDKLFERRGKVGTVTLTTKTRSATCTTEQFDRLAETQP